MTKMSKVASVGHWIYLRGRDIPITVIPNKYSQSVSTLIAEIRVQLVTEYTQEETYL